MEKRKVKKPDYEKLSKSVQVSLKPSEFRNLDRIRRDSPFPTIASYVRAIILRQLRDEKQTELF